MDSPGSLLGVLVRSSAEVGSVGRCEDGKIKVCVQVVPLYRVAAENSSTCKNTTPNLTSLL